MAKCKMCKHYKENPNFDLYDSSKGSFADCEVENDEFSEFEGILQHEIGYEIDCSDFEST